MLEIPINIVYILSKEYRRQFDWADWSDDELEEEFKREEDDLMALDKVEIEAEICEAEGELAKVSGSDDETDRFVFEKPTLAMIKNIKPLYITAMIGKIGRAHV